MNKDYAEIETSTGNVMAIINSHAKPIPPTGRKMIEYNPDDINPIGKKWDGTLWKEPMISLSDYKKQKIAEQKVIGMNIFKTFKDDFVNSSSDIPTKKTVLKDYFINTVKANIDAASDKVGIDSVVTGFDWTSI